mgnify:CR=1 FL=1
MNVYHNKKKKELIDELDAVRRERDELLSARDGNHHAPSPVTETTYRHILEDIDDAYWEVDLKGKTTFCNEALCRITGYSREELLAMADSLDWIMENPARTFHEALQACYLYHLLLSLEGSYLGLTIGRVDQHVGDYLQADLAAGRITLDEAQELMDCFFLKLADLFMSGPVFLMRTAGAYSNNMRITIGGRKPDGSDATNEATYLCLQTTSRLRLHDPNLSLALHKDSPDELWDAGIETSKKVGGVPTLDNADRIAELLHNRGLAMEDARNFCVCGCVEYSGSGCEYANASGPLSQAFVNVTNILLQAINNGVNPQNGQRGGLETGLLADMATFDEVKEAFKTQLEYFLDWQFTIYAICEYVGIREMPVPIASARQGVR